MTINSLRMMCARFADDDARVKADKRLVIAATRKLDRGIKGKLKA